MHALQIGIFVAFFERKPFVKLLISKCPRIAKWSSEQFFMRLLIDWILHTLLCKILKEQKSIYYFQEWALRMKNIGLSKKFSCFLKPLCNSATEVKPWDWRSAIERGHAPLQRGSMDSSLRIQRGPRAVRVGPTLVLKFPLPRIINLYDYALFVQNVHWLCQNIGGKHRLRDLCTFTRQGL